MRTSLALLPFVVLVAAAPDPKKAPDQPIAIVSDKVIGWPELTPMLAEAAGAQVLEEYALGRILRQECAKKGIDIGEEQVRAERELLGEMLASASRAPASESEALIEGVRRNRGLGEVRFKALLERNAALRAMVREGVGGPAISITPADLETAYELKYGPRIRARLILVRTEAAATQAKRAIDGGRAFADVAADVSIDPSASRGGLLEPVSLADGDYPVAVRTTLAALKPGETSAPISVTWAEQTGFVLVQSVESISARPDAPSRDAARKDLEREVRTVRERAAMDKLARLLLKNAGITVMDPQLNWSWEQRHPK